jgi:hypothetical protein
MISPRLPIGLKHSEPEPQVADPRRSYDRGVWDPSSGEPLDGIGEGTDEADAAAPQAAPVSHLAGISTDLLRRELERRQRGLETLLARRDAIRAEIDALDARIRELEDEDRPPRRAPAGAPRSARLALPRPKNSISLPDAIALEVEPGQTVTPADAAKRVLASGYQTTAKTFTMVVANALSKDKRFKRIGRGTYERA